MNIAILGGTGKEGAGLAGRWAMAGHSIIIGSRDRERAKAKAAELRDRLLRLGIGAAVEQVAVDVVVGLGQLVRGDVMERGDDTRFGQELLRFFR